MPYTFIVPNKNLLLHLLLLFLLSPRKSSFLLWLVIIDGPCAEACEFLCMRDETKKRKSRERGAAATAGAPVASAASRPPSVPRPNRENSHRGIQHRFL